MTGLESVVAPQWRDAFRRAAEVLRQKRSEILAPHIALIDARLGFKVEDGRLTKTPAIVVSVDPRQQVDLGSLPSAIDGIALDYVRASPEQQLAIAGQADDAGALRRARPRTLVEDLEDVFSDQADDDEGPTIGYRPPASPKLLPVTGAMKLTFHASPDAGWSTLQPFLEATKTSLTVSMYDFSAPHIVTAIRGLLRDSDVTLQLVLDSGTALPNADELARDPDSPKAKDWDEGKVLRSLKRAGRDRFTSVFAVTGKDGTFRSAYHTKVAVRDRKAFWLSSGNWQSSNQPSNNFSAPNASLATFREYNREWHVIVEHTGLSRVFEAFIKWDFDEAESFVADEIEREAVPAPALLLEEDFLFDSPDRARLKTFAPFVKTYDADSPLTVQPLMTPDNYLPFAQRLVESAQQTFYFQNQSLNIIKKPTAAYLRFLETLRDKSNDPNIDARFIIRNIGGIREKMESLQLFGFDVDRIRIQTGCHTKGMIVDGVDVLIGSHNCTNDGVEFNRDASLLLSDADVADYFTKIFEHDWQVLARPFRFSQNDIPILADDAATAASAMESPIRVEWSEYEDE